MQSTNGLDPQDWGACQLVNNKAQLYTLYVVGWTEAFLYALCFCLGLRNIYTVLYQRKMYKSKLLTLQYCFGQSICILKVLSFVFLAQDSRILMKHKVCNYDSVFKESPLEVERAFHDLLTHTQKALFFGFFTILCKICLGAVSFLVILSLYLKMTIIFNQTDPKSWESKYRIVIYAVLSVVLVGNLLLGIAMIVYFH
jgi:hypothetical protein